MKGTLMKIQKSQTGAGHLLLLLVVLLVAVIGLAGWRIMVANKASNNENATQTTEEKDKLNADNLAEEKTLNHALDEAPENCDSGAIYTSQDLDICYPKSWGTASLIEETSTRILEGKAYSVSFADYRAAKIFLLPKDLRLEGGSIDQCALTSATFLQTSWASYDIRRDAYAQDSIIVDRNSGTTGALLFEDSGIFITESVEFNEKGEYCLEASKRVASKAYDFVVVTSSGQFGDRTNIDEFSKDPTDLRKEYSVDEAMLVIKNIKVISR